LLTNNFSQIFNDKLSRFQGFFGTDTPSFLLSPEPLQALHPFVPLYPLVTALLAAGAGVW